MQQLTTRIERERDKRRDAMVCIETKQKEEILVSKSASQRFKRKKPIETSLTRAALKLENEDH